MSGYKDRKQRITGNNTGVMGTSSQDIIRLAYILFNHSHNYAKNYDDNVSPYALAGIPMLFSALRCLLIELSLCPLIHGGKPVSEPEKLSQTSNDVKLIKEDYNLPDDLIEKLYGLWEIRNEIIHPSHMPAGTKHNTPKYLEWMREEEILQSSGNKGSDYIWMGQLESHALFKWGASIVSDTVRELLTEHEVSTDFFEGIMASYNRFKQPIDQGD